MEQSEQIPQQSKNYMFYFFIAILILVVVYMAFEEMKFTKEYNSSNGTKINLTNITIGLKRVQVNNSNTSLVNYSIFNVKRGEIKK